MRTLHCRSTIASTACAAAFIGAVGPVETPASVVFTDATRSAQVTVSPFHGAAVRPEDTMTLSASGLGAFDRIVRREMPDPTGVTSRVQHASSRQISDFTAEAFAMTGTLEFSDAGLSNGLDSRVASTRALIAFALDAPTPWRYDATTGTPVNVLVSSQLLLRNAAGAIIASRLALPGNSVFVGSLQPGSYTVELIIALGSNSWLPSTPSSSMVYSIAFTLPAPTGAIMPMAGLTVFLLRRR